MDTQPPRQAQPPELRASDADRERTATVLRDKFSEGRLSFEEFQERLEKAYAAQTIGQLTELTPDLAVSTASSPMPGASAPSPSVARLSTTRITRNAARFMVIALFLIAIWAFTGGGYFWPIWPILGMALATAMNLVGGSRHRDRARRRRERYRG